MQIAGIKGLQKLSREALVGNSEPMKIMMLVGSCHLLPATWRLLDLCSRVWTRVVTGASERGAVESETGFGHSGEGSGATYGDRPHPHDGNRERLPHHGMESTDG